MFRRVANWLEDRTGIAALGLLIKHPVPADTDWWYALGSSILVALVILVATGIALATGYTADPSSAYHSIDRLTNSAVLGHQLRAVHYFAASAMGMHALHMFVSGSFKYPREVNWLVGVARAILLLIGSLLYAPKYPSWVPNLEAKPLPASIVGASSGPVWRGAQLFNHQSCEYCHRIGSYDGKHGAAAVGALRRGVFMRGGCKLLEQLAWRTRMKYGVGGGRLRSTWNCDCRPTAAGTPMAATPTAVGTRRVRCQGGAPRGLLSAGGDSTAADGCPTLRCRSKWCSGVAVGGSGSRAGEGACVRGGCPDWVRSSVFRFLQRWQGTEWMWRGRRWRGVAAVWCERPEVRQRWGRGDRL